jgi:hypothetical protein
MAISRPNHIEDAVIFLEKYEINFIFTLIERPFWNMGESGYLGNKHTTLSILKQKLSTG